MFIPHRGTGDHVLVLLQSHERINAGGSPRRRIAGENHGANEDNPSQRQRSRSLGWVSNRNDLTSRDTINTACTHIASPTLASSRPQRKTVDTTQSHAGPGSESRSS